MPPAPPPEAFKSALPSSAAPLITVKLTRSNFLGAFASSSIKQGTLVISEQPLFVVDAPLQAYLFQRAAGGSGPTPVEGDSDEEEGEAKTLEDFLDRGIRRTLELRTEEQRKAFYELANTHDELPPALGIFTTNAISTVEETGGLFLILSRFNSGCRPNLTRPHYDKPTRSLVLYALHDIEAGDELCWPYLGVPFEFDSIVTRRAEMQRVFGFECSCDTCDEWELSEAAKEESEARLVELRRLKEKMGGEKENREGVIKEMERLARLEKLWEVADRLKERLRVEAEESSKQE